MGIGIHRVELNTLARVFDHFLNESGRVGFVGDAPGIAMGVFDIGPRKGRIPLDSLQEKLLALTHVFR